MPASSSLSPSVPSDDSCDYSFVVLSYNRREKLALTLNRLLKLQGPHSFEVIVVDNASTDGTGEMLREKFGAVRSILLEKNTGITGWNEGFKVARGRWLFVLDDDSLPCSESILEDFAKEEVRLHHSAGICAFNVFWDEAATDSWSQGWMERELMFIGCGAAFRRDMVGKIGGFDANIFVYAHELDYSLNAFAHGFTVVYLPGIKIWHNSDKRTRFDDFWIFHTTWSTLYTVLKWMPMPDLVKGFAVLSFLYFRPALKTGTVSGWAGAHVQILRSLGLIRRARTPLPRALHRELSQRWLDAKPRSKLMRFLLKGLWIS